MMAAACRMTRKGIRSASSQLIPRLGGIRAFSQSAATLQVTTAKIKELRERSGAPMMDCKKALMDDEVAGDIYKAFDWLRKKGVAVAGKKAGRAAQEGVVSGVITDDERYGVLVEVSSETDFVARNADFYDFVQKVSRTAVAALPGAGVGEASAPTAAPGSALGVMEWLQKQKLDGGDLVGRECTVGEGLLDMVGKIRENLLCRRGAVLDAGEGGLVVPYVHNVVGPSMGSLAVLVAMAPAQGTSGGSTTPDEKARAAMRSAGKTVALHVAAARPLAVDRDSVPAEAVERESSVLAAQAREQGKPEKIVEKMVYGRLSKFYEESCLLEQDCMVADGKVGEIVAAAGEEAGTELRVVGFRVLAKGEVEEGEGAGEEEQGEEAEGRQ